MQISDFLPCLYSFVACMGFCVIFNIHGKGMLICCFGGSLGWSVYLVALHFGSGVFLANFLAAIVISAYSEIMSRIRKCPVTGYLIVSYFPLVPGAGIYYSMEYFINGDPQLALDKGLETVGIAGVLAIGVLLVSSVVRMLRILREHRPFRRAQGK